MGATGTLHAVALLVRSNMYAASGSRPFGRRVTQQLPENVKKVKIVLVGDSQVGKTRLFHGLLSRPMPTEGVPTTAGTWASLVADAMGGGGMMC